MIRNWALACFLFSVVIVHCEALLSHVQLLTLELNDTSLEISRTLSMWAK